MSTNPWDYFRQSGHIPRKSKTTDAEVDAAAQLQKEVAESLKGGHLPGIYFRDDPKMAYEEIKRAIQIHPELFFEPGGLDIWLKQYPPLLQHGIKNLATKYMQSIVDMEFKKDPYVQDKVSIPRNTLSLNMGSEPKMSEKLDYTPIVGPFSTAEWTQTNSPSWDSERGEFYLQKAMRHGARTLEPQDYVNLAEELGHDDFYKLQVMKEERDKSGETEDGT